MSNSKDIQNAIDALTKADNPPFLPQYGAITSICKKKKCCHKYKKKKGRHCGGCPKK